MLSITNSLIMLVAHTCTNNTNNTNANNANIVWLLTNGVNTNGAAAEAINFDRLGKKVHPGTFGNTKVG